MGLFTKDIKPMDDVLLHGSDGNSETTCLWSRGSEPTGFRAATILHNARAPNPVKGTSSSPPN
jgi:hypothetical protein